MEWQPKKRIINVEITKDDRDVKIDQMDEDNFVVTSMNKMLIVKFRSLDRVECNMTFVLPRFFEACPNQPNVMEENVTEVGGNNLQIIVKIEHQS